MASCKVTQSMLNQCKFIHMPEIVGSKDYDLRKLLDEYKFDENKALQKHKNKVGLKPGLSSLKRNERLPLIWSLAVLCAEERKLHKFYSGNRIRFHSSKGMPVKVSIRPFLSNLTIFPDGSILFKISKKELVPIMVIEVHSGTYKSTVCKTVSNVIDMFRLLRLYNKDVSDMIGFVFPRMETDTGVTKVTVKFDPTNFCFKVHLDKIAITNVKKELILALTKAKDYCGAMSATMSFPFFFKLSTNESDILQEKWGWNGTMTQVPTSHNMLFHVEDGNMSNYYKYIIDDLERTLLGSSCNILNKCAHAVRHDECNYLSFVRMVFKLPSLIPTLTFSEVEQCLYNFVRLTGDAIEAVHKLNIAHMDIRVPNVCFGYNDRNQLIAVLIDFDRMTSIIEVADPNFDGEMYRIPDGGNCGNLDWKQLGLLVKTVADIIDESNDSLDLFCVSLIEKGNVLSHSKPCLYKNRV